MRKKKWLSLLALMLAGVLVLVACGGGGEDAGQEGEDPTGDVASDGENQIIVGNTTELSGDWGAPYFHNNASDRAITQFIRGYKTTDVTYDGEFVIDETVVEDFKEEDNEDGSKTLTYKIVDGLEYSDGTPIDAKDYVANILFWNSKVVGDMKASNTTHMRVEGWSEYASGESKVFSGVRLLDDNTFSVTLSADELPYYYVLEAAASQPLNLAFWTDDTVEVKDDGEGAYLSDNFTLENFEDRITAARTEIPRPSSGPYILDSFDEASKTAVLSINDKYQGNFEGVKPSIETVIYKQVTNETAFDELETGQVDLLAEIGSGDEINKGLDLVDSGGFDYVDYPRAGYGKLVFVCDHGPTQSEAVRKAVAHLLDRNEFAKSFTGGFGTVVNGPYGEAQWFYQETKADLDSKLNQYNYDLDAAIALLEEDGWIYDENGNEYTEGVRHKKTEDGELVPLVLEWGSTEDNEVSDLLVVQLQKNPDLEKAGIKINQTTMDFTELLNYLYREGGDAKYEVPTFHMFNLATGFNPVYDQRNAYSTDEAVIAQGQNQNYIRDEELAEKARAVAQTEFGEREEFKEKFVDFIVKWNDVLPDLPLYSNIYHDFFNEKIENYDKNDLIDIPRAVLYANVVGFE